MKYLIAYTIRGEYILDSIVLDDNLIPTFRDSKIIDTYGVAKNMCQFVKYEPQHIIIINIVKLEK